MLRPVRLQGVYWDNFILLFLYAEQSDGARTLLRLLVQLVPTVIANRSAHLYLCRSVSQNCADVIACQAHSTRQRGSRSRAGWSLTPRRRSVRNLWPTNRSQECRSLAFTKPSNKSWCQATLRGSFPVCRVYRSVSTINGYCRNGTVRFLGKRHSAVCVLLGISPASEV